MPIIKIPPIRSKLPEMYGKIIGGVWEDQSKWMVSTTIPEFLNPYWRYNKLKVSTLYCNKIMVDPLFKVFKLLQERDLGNRIHSFDGCFAIRKSRRDERQSVHSWGLAIDLNASENPLGATPVVCQKLVGAFEEIGFTWGGRWSVPDGMHFQFVKED